MLSTLDLIHNILGALITLPSILGNLFMISFNFALKKDERNIYSLGRLSLSMANFGASLVIFMKCIQSFINLESIVHDIYFGMGFYLGSVSTSSVCLIAAQKFYAIVYPFKYSQITKQRQVRCILSIWMLYIPLLAGLLLQALKFHLPDYFNMVVVIYGQIVPFSAGFIATIAMFIAYLKHRNNNGMQSRDDSVSSNQRSHGKVVKVTSFMTVGYIITCGPASVMNMYLSTQGSLRVDLSTFSIEYLAYLLYDFNGSINIIVYILVDKQFRMYCKSILKKICHHRR